MSDPDTTIEELEPEDPFGDEPEVVAPPEVVSGGTFWTSGPGVDALDDPTPFGQENALQKLGKPPFDKKGVRGGFRLLGYLATVYEHVAADVGGKSSPA